MAKRVARLGPPRPGETRPILGPARSGPKLYTVFMNMFLAPKKKDLIGSTRICLLKWQCKYGRVEKKIGLCVVKLKGAVVMYSLPSSCVSPLTNIIYHVTPSILHA
jgi:hypothetical protein